MDAETIERVLDELLDEAVAFVTGVTALRRAFEASVAELRSELEELRLSSSTP